MGRGAARGGGGARAEEGRGGAEGRGGERQRRGRGGAARGRALSEARAVNFERMKVTNAHERELFKKLVAERLDG